MDEISDFEKWWAALTKHEKVSEGMNELAKYAAKLAWEDATKAEREACAKEAEHWQTISTTPGHACGQYIAAAIRGRSNIRNSELKP